MLLYSMLKDIQSFSSSFSSPILSNYLNMPKTPSLILPDSLPASWLTRSKINKRNKPTIFTLHHNKSTTTAAAAAVAAIASHGVGNAAENNSDDSLDFLDDATAIAAPSTITMDSSTLNIDVAIKENGHGMDQNMTDTLVVNRSDSVAPEFDSQYEFQYQPFHYSYAQQPPQQQPHPSAVDDSHNGNGSDARNPSDKAKATTIHNPPTTEPPSNNIDSSAQKTAQQKQTMTTGSSNKESIEQGLKRHSMSTTIQKAIEDEEAPYLEIAEEDWMQLDGLKPEAQSCTSNNSTVSHHHADNSSRTGNASGGSKFDMYNQGDDCSMKPAKTENNSQQKSTNDHKCKSLITASQSLTVEFQTFMEEHRQIKRSIEDKKKELDQYIMDRTDYLKQRQNYFQSQLKLLQEFL